MKHTQIQINPYADRNQYDAAKAQWLAAGKRNSFEAFRRDQCRRERIRLILNGTITPVYDIKPQMMNKVDGVWMPEIRTL